MLARNRLLQKTAVAYRVTPRKTRRRLVVALHAMVFLSACPLLFFEFDLDALRNVPVQDYGLILAGATAFMLVTGVIGIYCFSTLARNWNWVGARSEHVLIDERMQARKNHALANSFNTLAIVCVLEALFWFASRAWSQIMGELRQSPVQPQIVALLLSFNGYLAITMPMSILAWIEPDPVDEAE